MSYGPDHPVNFGPPHRVISATVINWANGLEGRPLGNDIAHLIRMLTENIQSDRAWHADLVESGGCGECDNHKIIARKMRENNAGD